MSAFCYAGGMNLRVIFVAASVLALADLHGQANNGSIDVPPGNRELLHVKGEGVQIYTCSQVDNAPKWTLKGPDAKLLDEHGQVIGNHSIGPTWTLNDGGAAQGQMEASRPAKDSVPWLRLRAKPETAKGSLAKVTYILRTETDGGVAPKTGCQVAGDVGQEARIHYTATYTFYVPE